MNSNAKRNVIIISFNTTVMLLWFWIKFILIPQIIPARELFRLERGGSGLVLFLFWVPLPLISIVGMIIEQHLRYWIIPDLVYCLMTFFHLAAYDHTYVVGGIGMFGFFGGLALIDRLVAFILMLLLQLIVKLILMLVKKIRSKKVATAQNEYQNRITV